MQTEFAAHGMNETLLHISVPGRYSLQVQSDQGTKIEIVDRMAGPFAAAGSAGEWDGRLDLLLDKGTYKIRLHSHEEGVGTLKLAVHPFVEVGSSINSSHSNPTKSKIVHWKICNNNLSGCILKTGESCGLKQSGETSKIAVCGAMGFGLRI